jgi:hypothetical protein
MGLGRVVLPAARPDFSEVSDEIFGQNSWPR